jgi:hypothetical protein
MKKILLRLLLFVCVGQSFYQVHKWNTLSLMDEDEISSGIVDFTGYIATYPISMRLNIKEKSNGNVTYTGYYYYNKVGTKIQLSGSWIMRPGTTTYIELNEIVNGNYTGSFSLLPKTYGDYSTLTGTWSGNGKTLKVKLTKLN